LIKITNLDRQVIVPASDVEPRNMGADLVVLPDGRWLLGYSRWLGGAHDDDGSQVCALISDDRGDNWSPPSTSLVPLRESKRSACQISCAWTMVVLPVSCGIEPTISIRGRACSSAVTKLHWARPTMALGGGGSSWL
jgi:hypothetical protein